MPGALVAGGPPCRGQGRGLGCARGRGHRAGAGGCRPPGRCRDLDQLSVELDQLRQLRVELDRLREEVTLLESLAGLPIGPAGQRERRQQAAQLRRDGFSLRGIAAVLHVDRATVAADLRALGVPPPPTVTGLDGRQTRPRHRPRA